MDTMGLTTHRTEPENQYSGQASLKTLKARQKTVQFARRMLLAKPKRFCTDMKYQEDPG